MVTTLIQISPALCKTQGITLTEKFNMVSWQCLHLQRAHPPTHWVNQRLTMHARSSAIETPVAHAPCMERKAQVYPLCRTYIEKVACTFLLKFGQFHHFGQFITKRACYFCMFQSIEMYEILTSNSDSICEHRNRFTAIDLQ